MVLDLMPVHNFCTKGEWGKNIVIFGAGNCLPQCADNRNSYFSSCWRTNARSPDKDTSWIQK